MATKSETIQAVADRAGVSKKDAEIFLALFLITPRNESKKEKKLHGQALGHFLCQSVVRVREEILKPARQSKSKKAAQ
jgi:nucleoid DNA-binding protein